MAGPVENLMGHCTATHRVRRFIVTTATVNQMRALLLELGSPCQSAEKSSERSADDPGRYQNGWALSAPRLPVATADTRLGMAACPTNLRSGLWTVPALDRLSAGMRQCFTIQARDLCQPGWGVPGDSKPRRDLWGNSHLRQMGRQKRQNSMKRDKSSLGEWVAPREASHRHHVVPIAFANKIMLFAKGTSGRVANPIPTARAAV